jgi:multidrug resistance efflux pump
VTGEKVHVARAGRVVEVNGQVGDRVKQGQVLIRLDPSRIDNDIQIRQRTIAAGAVELAELARQAEFLAQKYEVDRGKAESEWVQAQEEVRLARQKQDADRAAAEAELRMAEYEENQTHRLVRKGAASESEGVKAQMQLSAARANLKKARVPLDDTKVRVLRAALDQLAKEQDLRCSELEMKKERAKREIDTARRELANLELERKEMVIYAHTDGVVTSGEVRVGDVLDAGKAALAIAQEQGFRVDVAVPNAEIGHLREGMPVRIKLDAYDYQRYGTVSGTVSHISPDSQKLEHQQAVIYVVKAALDGDEVGQGVYRGQVKLGMTGRAEIVTGRESLLALLVKRVRQTISLG